MDVEVVGRLLTTLPEDDDHPYRTGPWRPQTTEWRADGLTVVAGTIPADLDGVYLRNTENPVHPAIRNYHQFDGDGMVHVVGFRDGSAFYRNRFVRTDGSWPSRRPAGRCGPGSPNGRTPPILNDCPLFWEPDGLANGKHLARFHPELPTRLGVLPRRGAPDSIRWFEAESTYVLHWVNAFEDGDEIVLDGFFQGDPEPADNGMGTQWERAFRFLALDRMQARLHRWRLNLVTGAVKEEQLSDSITEFGMMNADYATRPHRYTYAATGKPAWFLFDGLVRHDHRTGHEDRFAFGDGVFGSETAMAPRVGGTAEDDGYLITLTTDMNQDASFCEVFDAANLADGPICTLRLPERISSGTHSAWAAGADLPGWRTTEDPARAVGL